MANILVLHGPNLNLLGTREQHIYGQQALNAIDDELKKLATPLGHSLQSLQSNSESTLIDAIQQAPQQKIAMIIFNPAAFTHTSIALRDALLAVRIPFIEVHLSNIYGREAFRQQSYFSDIAVGTIVGFGAQSYLLALRAVDQHLTKASIG